MYSIVYKKSAAKELLSLPYHSANKIRNAINRLSENPYPAGFKKLEGSKNACRIRIGIYRIIYTIEHKQCIIEIIKVGHRKHIYR